MKNYFLCLKPLHDSWLAKLFNDMLNNNMKIVRISNPTRKHVKINTFQGAIALTAAEAIDHYLLFSPGHVKKGYNFSEVTSDFDLSGDNPIHIKLSHLKYEEFNQQNEIKKTNIYTIRKKIANFFSLNNIEAEKFLLISFLIFKDIKENYDDNNIIYNLPTYNKLEEMIDSIGSQNSKIIKGYFGALMKWNIKLSDLETINFAVIWAGIIALFIYTPISVIDSGVVKYGLVFSILMYVFDYIDNVVDFPFHIQQLIRLHEISNRLK